MTRTDQLLALAERQGIASIAKVVLEDEQYAKAITEKEFVDMLMECAKEYQRTGESVGQSFSRMFSADTPEALLLRKAHAAVRQANFPKVVTALPVSKSAGSAYDQIVAKANRLRELEPGLSFDQAFAKVFTDPANVNLTTEERRQNRPGPGASTSYPMPGGKH
jgi:hypothetical protein